jgi:hypothetical protein
MVISGSLVAAWNLSAAASSNIAATQPTQLHKQWLQPLTVLSSRHLQLTRGIVSVGWFHNTTATAAKQPPIQHVDIILSICACLFLS